VMFHLRCCMFWSTLNAEGELSVCASIVARNEFYPSFDAGQQRCEIGAG
jgi:hypothetical protein